MTSLGNRKRVAKDDLRVETYGTVDELNSAVGLAVALGVHESLKHPLDRIQNNLLDLGADLAFPLEDPVRGIIPRIDSSHVAQIEAWIDGMQSGLPPLKNFILPGGTPGAASLQVARTVCRRAERLAARLSKNETISEFILPYLNRLSDCLFVMARSDNFLNDLEDPIWKPEY
jgi:cob(I)alamin adenosyltransferase